MNKFTFTLKTLATTFNYEEGHLYEFSKELLINWLHTRTDFNIRSEHNNTKLADFTTSIMKECNELLRNLIDINNKILPYREKEVANNAILDELTKLQSPLMDPQPKEQQHKQPSIIKAKLLSFYSNPTSIPTPSGQVDPKMLPNKDQYKP